MAIHIPSVGNSQSTVPDPDPREAKAYQLYSSGDTVGSIKLLREMLADTERRGDDNATLYQEQAIVDMCVRAIAVQCMQAELPKLTGLYAKHLNDPFPTGALSMIWGTYYLGTSAYISGDPATIRHSVEQFFTGQKDAPNDYISYVRRHLLAAKMHLFLHEQREAIDAVNEVLSMIASTKDPRGWRIFIASWLSDCIGILTDAGDVQRAAGLYDVSGDFLARSYSPNTPDYAMFRLEEADLLIHTGDAKGAASASKAAVDALANMTLEPATKAYLITTARNTAALTLMLNHEIEEAVEQVDKNPANAKVSEILERGNLRSRDEVAFLATRAVVRAAGGIKPDSRDMKLLSLPIKINAGPLDMQAFEIYRGVGHAIVIAATDIAESRRELLEVGRQVLALQNSVPRGGFNIFNRPDLIGGLVFNLEMAAIGNNGEPSEENDDLSLKIMDLATRNARSFEAEALMLLGRAPSEAAREEIHDALRLYANRNRLEEADVSRVIKAITDAPSNFVVKEVLERDFFRRSIYGEYSDGLRTAEEWISAVGVEAPNGQQLVDLKDLQRVLHPHEAYLSVAGVLGNNLLFECVRSNRTRLAYQPFDPKQFANDARILVDALSALRPASEMLDSQYPTGAAVRVYDSVFKPFENCVEDGDSILWSPDIIRMPVPLAALLRSKPEPGRPLSEADWFAKHYVVSYIKSPATLVALRQIEKSSEYSASAFLGIGDPNLTGTTSTGEERAQLANHGAKPNSESAGNALPLAELPDTRTELEESARFFDRRVVLLADNATEADFRREPLSEFGYMSFATHGVLRSEIPGITEPTLLLTPKSSTDTEDDGLLEASEIADLTLHAKFVALSACSTANYDFASFAGQIPGLSAALAVAGVPSTLATLWPVESDASRRIVSRVFELVAQPESHGPAEALGEAQREYLLSPPDLAHGNPRYWAPFIILGDGEIATGAEKPQPRQIDLEGTQILTRGGGELSSLSILSDGTTITSGYGDRAEKRYASLITALGPDGKAKWRVQDYVALGSRTMVPLASGIVSASSHGMDKVESPKTISFTVTDYQGKQISSETMAEPKLYAWPIAAAKLGPDDAILAVLESDNKIESDPSTTRGLSLWSVSGRGKYKMRSFLDLSTRGISNYAVNARMVTTPEHIVVVITARDLVPPKQNSLDSLSEIKGCVNRPRSWIFWLDRNNFSKVGEKYLGSSEINSLERSKKGAVLATSTSYKNCGRATEVELIRIGEPKVEKGILSIKEPSQINETAITELEDGNIVLTGMIQRQVDVDPADHRGVDATEKTSVFDTLTRLRVSSRRRSDLLLYVLDRDLKLQARKEISFGGDAYVSAAATSKSDLVLAGSIGGEGALIRLSIPSVEH